MPHTYNLVTVNSRYCDYLRQYDYRVSYNANEKELRPFVGVLLDTPEDSKNISEMSKDEINDVLSRNLTNDEVTKEDIN